jgi:hypothetical protein
MQGPKRYDCQLGIIAEGLEGRIIEIFFRDNKTQKTEFRRERQEIGFHICPAIDYLKARRCLIWGKKVLLNLS